MRYFYFSSVENIHGELIYFGYGASQLDFTIGHPLLLEKLQLLPLLMVVTQIREKLIQLPF